MSTPAPKTPLESFQWKLRFSLQSPLELLREWRALDEATQAASVREVLLKAVGAHEGVVFTVCKQYLTAPLLSEALPVVFASLPSMLSRNRPVDGEDPKEKAFRFLEDFIQALLPFQEDVVWSTDIFPIMLQTGMPSLLAMPTPCDNVFIAWWDSLSDKQKNTQASQAMVSWCALQGPREREFGQFVQSRILNCLSSQLRHTVAEEFIKRTCPKPKSRTAVPSEVAAFRWLLSIPQFECVTSLVARSGWMDMIIKERDGSISISETIIRSGQNGLLDVRSLVESVDEDWGQRLGSKMCGLIQSQPDGGSSSQVITYSKLVQFLVQSRLFEDKMLEGFLHGLLGPKPSQWTQGIEAWERSIQPARADLESFKVMCKHEWAQRVLSGSSSSTPKLRF